MPYLPYFLLLFLPIIATGVLYIRYRQTLQGVWSRRVHTRVAELKSRREALVNPANRQQSPAEKLAEELFLKQRQNVPASVLQKYDNIGPATIEQLRKAGITNLVDAEEHVTAFLFKKKIENLGEFREAALKAAVSEHIITERRRFDAGSSAEGAEYQRRLANLSADEQLRAAAKAREVAALETCLDRMREFEAAADHINFTTWILRQPSPVDSDFMAKPFPSVEVADAPAPVSTSTSTSTSTPVSTPSVATPSGPPPQLAKLQAYCRFALIVAKADGRIAASERSTIRNYLAGRFGSDTVLMRHIDPQLEQAEADLPSEKDAIAGIKSAVPQDEWAGLYDFATQVADSAGGRNTKETQYLADLAAALNLSPEVAERVETKILTPSVPPPVVAPVVDHRAALDIDAKTPLTAELIRRKYAMLLDSTAKAKSLGGQYAKMAEAQEAAGKLAAEVFLADLGEPLVKPVPEESKDLRHNPDLDDLFK
ncbi:hypothetical protein BH11PLA2_BH11PLA2_34160 [soil metagenome]